MLATDPAQQEAVWRYMTFVTGAEGAKLIVENTGFAPTNAKVVNDASYLADFYAKNPDHKPGHEQIAAFAGPWYAYPGAEGVAVTDLIAAALTEVTDGGADAEASVKDLATTVRTRLGMKE
jgi:multiple sugar transport system substrate-binding protein